MFSSITGYFSSFLEDPPAFVLILTIWLYGVILGVVMLRSRWKNGQPVGLIPRERIERWFCLIGFPFLIAWVLMPGLAVKRRHEWLVIPEYALESQFLNRLRWIAAIGAVVALCLVVRCWVLMGKSWRIAIIPGEETVLVTRGLYATIRHPIYAFNILLVLCSMVVVPTRAMILVATPHIVIMVLKALREEQFLIKTHGRAYAEYCERTGRFLPRMNLR